MNVDNALTSIFVILSLFIVGSKCSLEHDKRIPPKLLERWKQVDYFQEKSKHNFTCEAEGSNLTFELYKNDKKINSNENGYFAFENLVNEMEGIYQCKVVNSYGTAITDKTNLTKAASVEFQQGTTTQIILVERPSDSCIIKCKPKNAVVPDPSITWFKESNKKEGKLDFSNDVQFDGKETLYFANVQKYADHNYWCSASNSFLRTSGNSTKSKIVTKSKDQVNAAPILLTSSSSSPYSGDRGVVIGFTNMTITMKCLFSGFPTPKVMWLKDNIELTSDLWDFHFGDTEITSSSPLNANDYDGDYICRGSNSMGRIDHGVKLIIRASPSFPNNDDHLRDAIILDGMNVTYRCSPFSNPPSTIEWFRNGVLLDANNLPNKYSIDSNGTELTISKVCRDCHDNDPCVIRCEARNQFGYNSSEGYLAVIDPTILDPNFYKDIEWSVKENLVFPCVVSSEPGFPAECSWFHKASPLVNGTDERVVIDENGTLSITTENDEDAGRSRLGKYKVRASNGHSSDEREFNVVEIDHGAIKESGGSNLWWISLIVLAILLLLLLLLLLLWCCCCRRRDRDDYPVDKKERLMGHDPVKELDNMGFHDYPARSSGNGDTVSYTQASGNMMMMMGNNTTNNNNDLHLPRTYYTNEVVDVDLADTPGVNRRHGNTVDTMSYRSNRLSGSIQEEPKVVLRREPSNRKAGNYPSGPADYNYDYRGDEAEFDHPNTEIILGTYPRRTSMKRQTYENRSNYPYNREPYSEV